MKYVNWKKGLSVLLVLSMILSFTPAADAYVKELVGGGTYKGFRYCYDKATRNVVLESYIGTSKTVVTPKKIKGKKVTELGSSIFNGNNRIEKLVISEGIEKIGKDAFFDMQSLKSISFPMSLRSLSDDVRLNFYTEASDFPEKTYTVVKGSPAFQYVTKKYSGSKIIVKKTNKVVAWFEMGAVGSDPAAKVVSKGKKYGKLPTVTRKGYRFLGWYTKKKGGKKVTAKTKAKKNQVLYAQWKYLGKSNLLANPKWDNLDKSTVWSTVEFGTYSDKTISWRVLSIKGKEALLMSKDAVAAKEYNERTYFVNELDGKRGYELPKECTWENSTIRSWLNGYPASYNVAQNDYSYDSIRESFYNTAFTSAEKTMILDSTVSNSGVTGKSTIDKVYLLSQAEWGNASYRLRYVDLTPNNRETSYYGAEKNTSAESYLWLRDMATPTSSYVYSIPSGNLMTVLTCGYNGTAGIVDFPDDTLPYVYPVIRVNLSNESLWRVGKDSTCYFDE